MQLRVRCVGTVATERAIPYRDDIEGLRAISVISVVLFHAIPRLLPGGFIGVDVFFVISGYLITSILLRDLENGVFRISEFYARRLIRLIPALLAVLLSLWVFGRYFLLADELHLLGKHVAAGALFVSNFVLLSESGYFDTSSDLKPLLHLWSLAIEEQFYIFWPILLAGLFRLPRKVALTLIVLIGLGSFGSNLAQVRGNPASAFYLLPARFWELLTGCMLAFNFIGRGENFFVARWPQWGRITLGMAPAFFFIAGLFSRAGSYPGWMAIFPVLAGATFITQGAGCMLNRWLSHPILRYTGQISYPWYLWHWPLLSIGHIIWSGEPPLYVVFTMVVLSYFLAMATKAFVENPVQIWSKGKSSWTRIETMVIPLLIIGFVGFMTSHGAFDTARHEAQGDLAKYSGYHLKLEKTGGWRCFLGDPAARIEDIRTECFEAFRTADVVAWGDSRMAQFVFGLSPLLQRNSLKFAFLGLSACPPILGLEPPDRPQCRGINDRIFQSLAEAKPRAVVLSGSWMNYDRDGTAMLALERTIHRLREAGIKRVIVIGQGPYWQIPLYKIVSRMRRGSSVRERYPPIKELELVNPRVRTSVETAGGVFIDLFAALCEPSAGCLTYIDYNEARELVVYDEGHVTETAAQFISDTIIGPVLMRELARP